ncbi:glycoside hydrolase family 3 C-terminal domain-containing protein [Luteimicrobium sp. NPDC057192]|uniref:glycoside hydrolase family 3 C-terminal domain-containing protein n=1 Tax=Luteimicrobium sp. NPDC057192 TaxID=3346042 RepID=UPI0036427660
MKRSVPHPSAPPRRRGGRSGLVATALVAGALVVPAHGALAASPAASPAGAACPWVTSHASDLTRAKQVLARMTLDEKITLVHGISDTTYAGAVAGVPRLCLPELKLSDGPSGIKLNTPNGNNFDGNTTQLPSETSLAASFDPSMATAYGTVMGQEGKTKGVDVSLSPTINIVRDPRWGRAFESMGEDPYLAGQIAAADVTGIQDQGVMAQVKHYAVYNQETNRGNAPDNAVVDDRTVHEIYTSAFARVVEQAKPASVMCSYSWINGTNACENGYLNGILKGEQGFDGFITSDWWGTKSTVAAANAGLDMEMPDDAHFGAALKAAVQAGTVPMSRLDDMVTRILREEFRFDLVAHPAPRTPDADAATPAHTKAAQAISEAGTVLLKNDGGVLPLGPKTRSIAVIGDGAGNNALTVGGGSAWAQGSGTVTPLDGITARAAEDEVAVSYAQGYSTIGGGALPAVPSQYLTPASGTGHGLTGEYFTNTTLNGSPTVTRTDSYVGFGWNGQPPAAGVPASNFSVRWTGTLTAPTTGTYTFSVTSDDGSRLSLDGARVIDNWADQGATTKTYAVDLTAGQKVAVEIEYYQGGGGSAMQFGWTPPGGSDATAEAVALAKSSDVAVVYANLATSEGSDLTSIDLPADQNALIEAVAKANPRTVVVLNTGSAVTMPWVDDVAGVVEAWYPGQEAGNAIASVLFGDTNPSGKLPVTFPKSLADVPASTDAQFPGTDGKVEYSEGLDVGYRWYDAKDVEPLFPFGYGLSYTTFRVSGLHVSQAKMAEGGAVKATATVTNTGKVAGSDVVQFYLSQPTSSGEPPKSLVGFQKVTLEPGRSKKVSVTITARDASVWNTKAQSWALTPGTYTVRAGDSSSSLPTKDYFSVTKTTQPRSVTVGAPAGARAGSTVDVTTTFTNGSTTTARDVRTSLELPDGWTTASLPTTTRAVAPGASVQATWKVSVPADATTGAATIRATSQYVGGHAAGTAAVTVPYASLAAAYDTVGVSDDADETAGNLDGTGYSFSLQALASVGVVPGQPIPGGYGGLVFPQITAGEPNVVSAAGQTVTMSGSGASLALLAVGTSGEQKGTLTVTYTDGTTSSGAVDVNDWFYNQAVPGSVVVATTPYWNRPAGSTNPHAQRVSLYATQVPLTPGKEIASVTLPTNPQLRVFAAHVTG